MSLNVVFVLFAASLIGVCPCTACDFMTLASDLNLSNQSADVRPVQNWSTDTTVRVNMILFNVVRLDTSTQTLLTYLWFSLEWENEFIKWNPADYCGISSFLVSYDNLWQPSIYIPEMTEADDKNPVALYHTINSTGTVRDSKPLRIVSTCNLEIFLYPFDIQNCVLSFETYQDESFAIVAKYNSEQVFYDSKEYFLNKGEWQLINITVGTTKFGVQYTITLKRSPAVQIIAFIIPICFLVLLDVAGMFINFTEGERIMFKIVVFLGFSVLMVILTKILPTTDSPPLLCLFCFICMTFMVASLMGCITTSYLLSLSETSAQAPRLMTFWIKTYLARVLFFKMQDDISKTPDVLENGTVNLPVCLHNVTENELLRMLLKEVQNIQDEMTTHKTQEDGKSDWHIIALVLNRLFTILYLLAIIITFIVTFSIWGSHYSME